MKKFKILFKRALFLGCALVMFFGAMKAALTSYDTVQIILSFIFGWSMALFIDTFEKGKK